MIGRAEFIPANLAILYFYALTSKSLKYKIDEYLTEAP